MASWAAVVTFSRPLTADRDYGGANDEAVTVPANQLSATLPTDRMPAILAYEDWATWLGESGTPEEAKACLKIVEGVRWTMTKEERAARTKRGKPTVSDPGGLL
jgi:putative SOS response-associated peptidase YedK